MDAYQAIKAIVDAAVKDDLAAAEKVLEEYLQDKVEVGVQRQLALEFDT